MKKLREPFILSVFPKMKRNKKRKRTGEENFDDSDVFTEDEPSSDDPPYTAAVTNLPPVNLSVEALTKIYTDFTSPLKVQQPLLEGNIATLSI